MCVIVRNKKVLMLLCTFRAKPTTAYDIMTKKQHLDEKCFCYYTFKYP